jgi:hydroxymethylbilane synthase
VSTSAPLRLGTRASPMAVVQTSHVADLIRRRTGRAVELVKVTTFGDVSRAMLSQIGGTGVFVSGLRARLADGDIDVAVHSLKDLPTAAADGIVLAAVPARDDPRDALVTADRVKLADLPPGARIGTGSPRRAAQLRLLRPDSKPVGIRGNAGTRLAKVSSGQLDAVVLGYAGLARIGSLDVVSEIFEPDEMLPAPGQGALAVECRIQDAGLRALLSEIEDPPSRAAVAAERAVLAALQGGCSAPVGGYAVQPQGTETVRLRAAVFDEQGCGAVRASGSGPAARADDVGRDVAAELLRLGAGTYISVPQARQSDGGEPS